MTRALLPELDIKRQTLFTEIQLIRLRRNQAKARARHNRNRLAGRDPRIKRRRDGTKEPDLYELAGPVAEENRAKVTERVAQYEEVMHSMDKHHKQVVRPIARATHIAYCLMRGRHYPDIEEPRIDNIPDWNRVRTNLERFGLKELPIHNSVWEATYKYEKQQREAFRAHRAKQAQADASRWLEENPTLAKMRREEAASRYNNTESEFQRERALARRQ